MLKSYGGRYGIWVGAGKQSKTTFPVTIAWLRTVLPPYLRGVGLNLSLAKRSFRIGVYKGIAGYVSNEYDDGDITEDLAALEWRLLGHAPEVITKWESTSGESETSGSSQSEPKQPQAPPVGAPETAPVDSTDRHSSTGPSPSP